MGSPIEISTISSSLKDLGDMQVLLPHVRDACNQAASLLTQMREVLLTPAPDGVIVEKLRWILAKQGEG